MDILITVDASVFSADVVTRTAHRYTNDFCIDIRSVGNAFEIRLTPLIERAPTVDVAGRFRNDLLDDRLRARISEQTAELHTVLARAALHESLPKPSAR